MAPNIASLWLMPRLRRFAHAHHEIPLTLLIAHNHSDIVRGQAGIESTIASSQCSAAWKRPSV